MPISDAGFNEMMNGLDAERESPIAEAARESALLASLALQHGCPLETLLHALDGRDIGPLAAAPAAVAGLAGASHVVAPNSAERP